MLEAHMAPTGTAGNPFLRKLHIRAKCTYGGLLHFEIVVKIGTYSNANCKLQILNPPVRFSPSDGLLQESLYRLSCLSSHHSGKGHGREDWTWLCGVWENRTWV